MSIERPRGSGLRRKGVEEGQRKPGLIFEAMDGAAVKEGALTRKLVRCEREAVTVYEAGERRTWKVYFHGHREWIMWKKKV